MEVWLNLYWSWGVMVSEEDRSFIEGFIEYLKENDVIETKKDLKVEFKEVTYKDGIDIQWIEEILKHLNKYLLKKGIPKRDRIKRVVLIPKNPWVLYVETAEGKIRFLIAPYDVEMEGLL